MDLREHINNATGGALEHHRVLEGGCKAGGVWYLMFGNMKKRTTVICKVKAGKAKEVMGASKPLHVGHANDCCVRGSTIYITASGESNTIHRVHAISLVDLPDVKVEGCSGGFNAISCMGSGYIVKKMASRKCFVLDKTFRYKKTIKLQKTRKVGQGMTWDEKSGRLYRGASQGQSTKNYVTVYNSKGKVVKEYRWKHKGELEDVFISAGWIVISIYRKVKVKKKKKFKAFLKRLAKAARS